MKFFQSIGAKTIGKLTAIGRATYMLMGALLALPRLKTFRLPLNRFMWWAFSLC